jgi:hypothetical protein
MVDGVKITLEDVARLAELHGDEYRLARAELLAREPEGLEERVASTAENPRWAAAVRSQVAYEALGLWLADRDACELVLQAATDRIRFGPGRPLGGSSSPAIRAAYILRKIGSHMLPRVQELLLFEPEYDIPYYRETLYSVMQESARPENASILIYILSGDRDRGERAMACDVLGHIDSSEARSALRALFADGREPAEMRAVAARALSLQRDTEALAPAGLYLRAPETAPDLRSACAKLIAKISGDRALPELEELYSAFGPVDRNSILQGFRRLRTQAAYAALMRLQEKEEDQALRSEIAGIAARLRTMLDALARRAHKA